MSASSYLQGVGNLSLFVGVRYEEVFLLSQGKSLIGVFDSGYGGLSVLRELRKALPQHDFCYLGDSGRGPYGGRDVDVILDFSEQAVERLFSLGCRLVIVACNTVSCVALRHLQRRFADDEHRILGITIPAAEAAVQVSEGHIAVVATARTVSSGTYTTEIHKLSDRHRVTEISAPLLAAIVEEGWETSQIAQLAVARYLRQVPNTVDTVVFGCTHYPFLHQAFASELASVRLLDPAVFAAEKLVDWLGRHPGFVSPTMTGSSATVRVLCTGDPARFRAHAERFLGEQLPSVEHIAEVAGRLLPREPSAAPKGQVVR